MTIYNFMKDMNEEQLETLRKQNFFNMDSVTLKKALEPHYYRENYNLANEEMEEVIQELQKIFKEQNLHNKSIEPLSESELADLKLSTPCITAIIGVVFDIIALFFQYLAIRKAIARIAALKIIDVIKENEELLIGLERKIKELAEADNPLKQAIACWGIMGDISNLMGVRIIIQAVTSSMKWYDLFLSGAAITAQMVIWFATDGTALIAELVMATVLLANLTEDAVRTVQICSSNTCNKQA